MKKWRLRLGEESLEVGLAGPGEAVLGERRVAFTREEAGGGIERIKTDGAAHRLVAVREGQRVFVWCDGAAYVFDRAPRARGGGADHGAGLAAPMPGRVRRIFAAPGEAVARGAVLLAVEAMKMEHAIRAPRDGVVRKILVREGDLVDAGTELVELEATRP